LIKRKAIPALGLKGLVKSFDKVTPVLDGLDLTIEEGEVIGVLGPNGSGKTTLLRLIQGMIEADSGEIMIHGSELKSYSSIDLARMMAFVPQETNIAFPFSVMEVVLQGRYPYLNRFGFENADDMETVERVMDLTETLHLRNRWIADLSGGERQRVILARALAQSPRIMLLDEPTSFLDIKHQVKIHELLRELNRDKGMTVVCVLHDLTMASTYFDRLCLIHEGKVKSIGAPQDVMKYDLIKKVYGAEVYIDINSVTGRPYIIPLGRIENENGREPTDEA